MPESIIDLKALQRRPKSTASTQNQDKKVCHKKIFALSQKEEIFLQDQANLEHIANIMDMTPAQAMIARTRGMGYGRPSSGTQLR